MKDFTDINEKEVALLTLAHVFRNLNQLHFEIQTNLLLYNKKNQIFP